MRHQHLINLGKPEKEQPKLVLSESEYNRYNDMGYFDGIQYRWESREGHYYLYMDSESYMKVQSYIDNGKLYLIFNKVIRANSGIENFSKETFSEYISY